MSRKIKHKIENYYDKEYFDLYQKEIGEFGGMANLFKFKKYINDNDTVLDFGCGGGFVLKNLNCKEKIGIDLNSVAREYCNNINKITCYESIESIEDESVDIIISNNCLEHVTNPYDIIRKMYQKLKINGRIVIVLPCDNYKQMWRPNDVDNHLYSFSPMNLGNLLQGCGFKEIRTKPILHKWPPFYKKYILFLEKVFSMLLAESMQGLIIVMYKSEE